MRAAFLDFDSLGPADVDRGPLTRLLPDCAFFGATQAAARAERVAQAEVVFVNKVVLDEPTLAAATSLRLICVAATGTDNVDLDAARRRRITVCNIRDYCTPSVVQHVYALLLTLNQRLPVYRKRVARGDWSGSMQFCLLDPPVQELAGKTLGVVGLGTLGRAVAAAGTAFGLEVLTARRPYRRHDESQLYDVGGTRIPRIGFGALLAKADYLSLHCPLTHETAGLIDDAALARMRPGTILINTARGGLVEPRALLEALASGRLGGAGIDVLDAEPPPADHPLTRRELPNLVVTPHIAWAAREARQRAIEELAANVAAFQRGAPRNRVA
jgi:glycerate dehydrogenase